MRRWNGLAGSTTAGCSSRSGTFRWPSMSRRIIDSPRLRRWWPDSTTELSGNPSVVHGWEGALISVSILAGRLVLALTEHVAVSHEPTPSLHRFDNGAQRNFRSGSTAASPSSRKPTLAGTSPNQRLGWPALGRADTLVAPVNRCSAPHNESPGARSVSLAVRLASLRPLGSCARSDVGMTSKLDAGPSAHLCASLERIEARASA